VVINLIDNNIYSRLIFMCGPAVDEKYKMTCESVQDVMSQSNRYNIIMVNLALLSQYFGVVFTHNAQ